MGCRSAGPSQPARAVVRPRAGRPFQYLAHRTPRQLFNGVERIAGALGDLKLLYRDLKPEDSVGGSRIAWEGSSCKRGAIPGRQTVGWAPAGATRNTTAGGMTRMDTGDAEGKSFGQPKLFPSDEPNVKWGVDELGAYA